MNDLQQRIQRGMTLLDEKQSGWREKVNLDTLDMSSSVYGLLEQVSDGSYGDGLKLLRLQYSTAASFGFDLNDESDIDGEEWEELTQAWIEALTREVAG